MISRRDYRNNGRRQRVEKISEQLAGKQEEQRRKKQIKT
jgi:hypothetical protein